MFADNIHYYRPVFSGEDLISVQSDVMFISNWVASKPLKLNTKRQRSRSSGRKILQLLKCVSRNPPLEQVSNSKYLGVTISGNLTWSTHILASCCKAKHLIGFLYRNLFKDVCTRCIVYLYKTIVLPVLEYCNYVWLPTKTNTSLNWSGGQTFAARLVTRQWLAVSDLLRNVLHWPLLSAHCSFHKLCLCKWILCEQSLISSSFFISHPSLIVRRANYCPLFQPYVKTIVIVKLWNSVPEYIISLNLYLVLKKHVKHYWVV